jgi:hypothetical protein
MAQSEVKLQDDQSSVAEGPLADAHCLHCGYSLRGLPENRCPECGTAFDPADFADAFLPLWPQLFMWYLIAIVVRSLTELPRTIDLLSSLATKLTTQTHLHNAAIDVTSCLIGITVPALGLPAIWGFYRRRDWARRISIPIFVIACLYTLAWLGPVPLRAAGGPPLKDHLGMLIRASTTLASGVLPALLIVFLLTGLRPHSLTRRQAEQPPLLSLKSLHPKQDWLLLTCWLLVGSGTAGVLWGTASLNALLEWGNWLGVLYQGRWRREWVVVISVARFAAATCAVLAAVWIWRRPERLRPTLVGVAILSAIPTPLGILLSMSRTANLRLTCICQSVWPDLKGPLLVPLVLLLFAFLAVKREDINRLTRNDRSATG